MIDQAELDRFARVQQLAYRCAEQTAASLEPGVTEREAARRLGRALRDAGVEDVFHVPFAWFGDRTAFTGFRLALQFFPTNRRLEQGMAFILDCAPIIDGYTADIGYSGSLGTNRVVDAILDDLAEHRALILREVRERRPFAGIYAHVDALAARQGYDCRHKVYPGRVIGHEVWRETGGLPRLVAGGFGIRSLRTLRRELMRGRREGWSPLWAGGRASEHAPHPGLWAVEPHLGFRGTGAKFEEILVVTEEDAFWLDDDLPHVRRWAAAA
jgi:Xaa-Pro aminopeptidase